MEIYTWDSNLRCPYCNSNQSFKSRFMLEDLNKCDVCLTEFWDDLTILNLNDQALEEHEEF